MSWMRLFRIRLLQVRHGSPHACTASAAWLKDFAVLDDVVRADGEVHGVVVPGRAPIVHDAVLDVHIAGDGQVVVRDADADPRAAMHIEAPQPDSMEAPP